MCTKYIISVRLMCIFRKYTYLIIFRFIFRVYSTKITIFSFFRFEFRVWAFFTHEGVPVTFRQAIISVIDFVDALLQGSGFLTFISSCKAISLTMEFSANLLKRHWNPFSWHKQARTRDLTRKTTECISCIYSKYKGISISWRVCVVS